MSPHETEPIQPYGTGNAAAAGDVVPVNAQRSRLTLETSYRARLHCAETGEINAQNGDPLW